VLEIGSGTGQHAVYFARQLPHLRWQASDVAAHLRGIRAWIDEAALPNLPAPLELNVDDAKWPALPADALFTANTLHIMSWPQVQRLFERAGALLGPGALLAVYGPFKYRGLHTAESNARFDLMLRERDPGSGLRDFEQVDQLAVRHQFTLMSDEAMPANNRTLVWRKKGISDSVI
jgi:cyclopropane fatty-acyl-phospholipid synthase-like methyltransferase